MSEILTERTNNGKGADMLCGCAFFNRKKQVKKMGNF